MMRMADRPDPKPPLRRATNVSLRADLTEEARRLELNISQACEEGLAASVKRAREAEWLDQNRAAIESSNQWVEKHGLPLARFRPF
jgi:antitoxin CcdA